MNKRSMTVVEATRIGIPKALASKLAQGGRVPVLPAPKAIPEGGSAAKGTTGDASPNQEDVPWSP